MDLEVWAQVHCVIIALFILLMMFGGSDDRFAGP